MTSPVEAAHGPLIVETVSGTKYELGKPAKVEKWLVPHRLKKLFHPGGFTESWANEISKLANARMTRHTPHKDRPVTPIIEMHALDDDPQLEDISIASTIQKPIPKKAVKRTQPVKKQKPIKKTQPTKKVVSKPKRTSNDPLAVFVKPRAPPSARFNYKEDSDSSDYSDNDQRYTPAKPKKPRRARTSSKAKVTKKKTTTKSGKRKATPPPEEEVLSPAKRKKTTSKKITKASPKVVLERMSTETAELGESSSTKAKKKTKPPSKRKITAAKEKSQKKDTNPTEKKKSTKARKKKTPEVEEKSFALTESPIPAPVPAKKKQSVRGTVYYLVTKIYLLLFQNKQNETYN